MPELLTPDQVCELIPGLTTSKLAQLRFTGHGPRFMKPTTRTVVYDRGEVEAWLRSTLHERTDKPVAATA